MKTAPEVYGEGYTGNASKWVFGPSATSNAQCPCGWVILDPDFFAGKCLNCEREFK